MKTSIVLALVLAVAACKGDSPSTTKPAAGPRIAIAVTESGFTPGDVHVPQGTPVTLVFERKTDATCAKEVVLEVGDQTIKKALPLATPVEVAVTFPTAGKLTYACGMDMVKGVISVDGT